MTPRARHGNSHPNGAADVGRVLVALAKVAGAIVGAVALVVGSVGAYYGIIGRIDRIDVLMSTQGKTLETLAGSIRDLAAKAATADEVDSKIERACLQMQIANQASGWACPASGMVPPPRKTAKQWVIETSKQ